MKPWNYETMNNIHWNTSELKWQLEILHKYYPIGMEVEFYNDIEPTLDIDINTSHKFMITEYKTRSHFTLNVYDPITKQWYEIHAGFFKPTKRYLRDKKLERIVK